MRRMPEAKASQGPPSLRDEPENYRGRSAVAIERRFRPLARTTTADQAQTGG